MALVASQFRHETEIEPYAELRLHDDWRDSFREPVNDLYHNVNDAEYQSAPGRAQCTCSAYYE